MRNYATKLVVLVMIAGGLCSCTSKSEETAEQVATSVTSHPKGQASVEDDVSDKNILQIAMSSDAHTTLVAAVEAAQIEHVLVNAGPLTVFAPVNEAFDALPEGTVENLLLPENKPQLAEILTRHAAPGSFDIDGLKKEASRGRKLYMATGDYLEVVVRDDKVTVAGAEVIATIPASNGIIQVVNRVILPSN